MPNLNITVLTHLYGSCNLVPQNIISYSVYSFISFVCLLFALSWFCCINTQIRSSYTIINMSKSFYLLISFCHFYCNEVLYVSKKLIINVILNIFTIINYYSFITILKKKIQFEIAQSLWFVLLMLLYLFLYFVTISLFSVCKLIEWKIKFFN